MGDQTTKYRRQIGYCRVAVVTLSVIAIALLVAVIAVAMRLNSYKTQTSHDGSCPKGDKHNIINLEPPSLLSPFYDLTPEEILGVKEFLYADSDLNLVRPDQLRTNASYIFTMEILIPDKDEVLNYLDKDSSRPDREAKVILFRGDKPEAHIDEYIVGPLPHPVYKKNHVTHPFRYRPFTTPELYTSIAYVTDQVHASVSHILQESYDGSLKDCGKKCLAFQIATPVSPSSIGEPRHRKMWYWLSRVLEFSTLHHLDLLVLVDLTHKEPEKYTIDKVIYANEIFDSLDDLKTAYDQGSFTKTNVPFPEDSRQLFSSLNRRGTMFPSEPLDPPEQYEPSGHRYSINGRHIQYMGWDFDIRMSTIAGPQLYDIRHNKKRIVYELSLQEISVMYSGHTPANRFSDFADSVALIGSRSRGLVPGTDCPKHATYIPATHSFETSVEAVTYPTAFCVFEHNTAMPLRRHLAFDYYERQFYEGMVDSVLIVRTIATVVNYDYIFDFIFHQNGAVEVKAVSTGYILTSFRFPQEDDYGYQLRDHLTGNIHHHMFHFKVDMDINGRENRFKVLEVTPVTVSNSKWSADLNAQYSQTKVVAREMLREKDAAMKYNFDTPKYLTFYNKDQVTAQNVPRAYRLFVKGMSKQLFAPNNGAEASFPWARYQVAVTKHKDTEPRSSSLYAIWDAMDPVVNFQEFIDDNEIISDQDQVTWVAMGLHHIPHMEDLPITPTVGLALEFFLLPYNYFDEDPAMGSSDAIRIEPNKRTDGDNLVKFQRYGKKDDIECKPRTPSFMGKSYEEEVDANPDYLFNQS